jgi:hypothetical protein
MHIMPTKIMPKDVVYAKRQLEKGKTMDEIATELSVSIFTLKDRLGPKRKQSKIEDVIKKNLKRQAIVNDMWAALSIGKHLQFQRYSRMISGEIFYLDEQKVGIINDRGRKQFVTINDVMPIPARIEVS